MQFEWDEAKRRSVLAERRVDILHAARIFAGRVLTRGDDRRDSGEPRYVSVGLVDGECFIVVHTRRDEVTRLIAAWKGGKADHEQYEKRVARGDRANEP